jgi:hypothetical protein
MAIKNIISFIGKRELTALAILAAAFAAFLAFDLNLWSFVAVSVLFVGYVSRTASAFFVTQHNYSGRRIAAYAMPVGLAIVQALVCLGLVWLIVWSVRHMFGNA